MFLRCFLDVSVAVGIFVIGLSQISSFFSFYLVKIIYKPPAYIKQKLLQKLVKYNTQIERENLQ